MTLNSEDKSSRNHNDASYSAWLLDADPSQITQDNDPRFSCVVCEETSEVLEAAVEELRRAMSVGRIKELGGASQFQEDYVVLGTPSSNFIASVIDSALLEDLGVEGYVIQSVNDGGKLCIILAGNTHKGCLYAVFHFLRLVKIGSDLTSLSISEMPRNKIRMINQWDNMDGSIERGYAGNSIFYENNQFVSDLSRVNEYARLLASVGINAISIIT